MVTARRREESLQDTPVAVTVVTSEMLERMQIEGTTDLDRVAPNLQFHTYGTLTGNNSAAQVFIRGIGQTDATPAVDPGVGLYIDDVYMGRSVGGAMEMRDIASVQVLRGPQGTLFGRNTIG
ncbi:MAG: Plug domain-containing protein, partial [Pseudomonadota bacterium]